MKESTFKTINTRMVVEKIELAQEEAKTKSGLYIPTGSIAKDGSIGGGVLSQFDDHPYKAIVFISSHPEVKKGDIVYLTQHCFENSALTANIKGKIYEVITQSDVLFVETEV